MKSCKSKNSALDSKSDAKKVKFNAKVHFKYFTKTNSNESINPISTACKRKNSGQDDETSTKKAKFEDNVCNNLGCNKIGTHWCHFPKVINLNPGFKTDGMIHTNSCLVDGVPYFSQFLCSFIESHGILFLFKYNGGNTIRILSVNVGDSNQSFCYKLKLKWNHFSSTAEGTIGDEKKIAIFGYESSTLDYEIEITPKGSQ